MREPICSYSLILQRKIKEKNETEIADKKMSKAMEESKLTVTM